MNNNVNSTPAAAPGRNVSLRYRNRNAVGPWLPMVGHQVKTSMWVELLKCGGIAPRPNYFTETIGASEEVIGGAYWTYRVWEKAGIDPAIFREKWKVANRVAAAVVNDGLKVKVRPAQ